MAHLIGQARPNLDADALAHALLASVSAELLHVVGAKRPRHRAAVLALADAVVPARC